MKLLLSALAVTVVVVVSAVVLHAEERLEVRFRQFDKDGDGRVSMAELEGAPKLKRLDLDGDGHVTLSEAREGLKRVASAASDGGQPLDVVFKGLDKNGDARLTREELANEEWFTRLDADKDGAVLMEEARAVIGSVVPRRYQSGTAGAPPPVMKPDDSLKEQPQMLKAAEHGVGRMVAEVSLKDDKGGSVSLAGLRGEKGLLLALFSANCPISQKLGPELARIERLCEDTGVTVVLLNTVPDEAPADVHAFVTTHGLKARVLSDAESTLLRALGATTTTEVFLLDAARTLVYRGAVNDQYGLGYAKEAPTRSYLREALTALKAGEAVKVAATTAPGCALSLPAGGATVAGSAVTYHREVSRIMQSHCVECHRRDGAGPFSLETMAGVLENAGMIKKQVMRGAMPPWFAAKGAAEKESPWRNDCSLAEQDKKDLLAWLDSDRPAGDPKDAPVPRSFASSWTIGEPDAVFQLPKPFLIKAEGTMPYQHAVVETSFPEDRWVQAYEILPTAPSVVHHVIVRVHPKGSKIGRSEEGREGYWAAYVPGNTHRVLPEGFAKKLPAGATISFQMHYTPNGRAVEDQLRIGLKFSKEPPRNEVHVVAVAHGKLNIPAGAANHVEMREQPVPTDMMFTGYMAHMHVRGKAFKYEVTHPDGRSEVLLDIPRYDFNWQLAYDYKQPKFIPRGSVVKITAVYDNSAGNPANPDPTKVVRWGSQTFDEMMIGYIEHVVPLAPPSVAALKTP